MSNPYDEMPQPREDARFEPLKARSESHHREYLPELTKNLEKKGQFDEHLSNLTEQAIKSLHESQLAGLNPDQARELAYPLIFPEPESD
jgi:hypothetical protein